MTNEIGYVALIHPHTFMFIKTFEDVRKFIISNVHITLLVDYGLDRVNLFGPGILLDAAWYVLSKKQNNDKSIFFNISANQQEKNKMESLMIAFQHCICNKKHDRVYIINQNELKIIQGWPIIYWFSKSFRNKFKTNPISDYFAICKGLTTGKNERFLRYKWELKQSEISIDYIRDDRKWVPFAKGGPFNKWFGNLWLCVNWENNGFEIKNFVDENGKVRSRPQNEQYYLQEGITSSLSSSRGISFRYLPKNYITEGASAGGFLFNDDISLYYYIALLNSNLIFYIADSLNASVTTEVGDLKKIPFQEPTKEVEKQISTLVSSNIDIKRYINSHHLIEDNYCKNPLLKYSSYTLRERLLSYLNDENAKITLIILNETILNKLILDLYDLNGDDRKLVEMKMGKLIGDLPVDSESLNVFISENLIENEQLLEHIEKLQTVGFNDKRIGEITNDFSSLYQKNYQFEDFCKNHQINPINVWYWFRESNVLPKSRAEVITMEFIADALRTILNDDEDGIIPLAGFAKEPRLVDRLEHHCINKGFTSAQFMQLDGLLGRSINNYLEQYFFQNFSNHLNLFMYLPKTPFIWHLSSGKLQGFEAYIIIYKWNRDSLFKLRSKYLSKRKESLQYRQIELKDNESAQAQNEKETINLQLKEIEVFTKKIDELIAEGYDPKLDDGVGKNIAPLQKKGLLRCDVLSKTQLEKYLKADW